MRGDAPRLRSLAVAASFANLCLLRVWAEAPPYISSEALFDHKWVPGSAYYMSYLVLLGLLICVLYPIVEWSGGGAGTGARKRGERLWLACLVVPINAGVNYATGVSDMFRVSAIQRVAGEWGMAALVAGGAGVVALAVMKAPGWAVSWSRGVVLLLSPLVVLTVSAAVIQVFVPPMPLRSDLTAGSVDRGRPGNRVVWVILDEWDYRLTFEDRPGWLALPAMDRIRGESLSAAQASPPADYTQLSIPSLLTGRIIDRSTARGPAEFYIAEAGGGYRRWQEVPNLFDTAALRGTKAAVLGSFMPYCRLLMNQAVDCWWWQGSFVGPVGGKSWIETLALQARLLVETKNFSPIGQPASFKSYCENHVELMDRARLVLSDRSYGFILIHVPVLHRPFFYDRQTGGFTKRNNPVSGYFDALALADGVLGEYRSVMEKSGTWDESYVILSADHSFRASDLIDRKRDRRIPFIVRLPHGGRSEERVDFPINTVLTPFLIQDMMRDGIPNYEVLKARMMELSRPGSRAGVKRGE